MIKLLNVKVETKLYGTSPIEYLEDTINKKMNENNIKDSQIINIEIVRSTEAIISYRC